MTPHFTWQMAIAFLLIGWLTVFVLFLHFKRGEGILDALGEASVFYFAVMIPLCIWSL